MKTVNFQELPLAITFDEYKDYISPEGPSPYLDCSYRTPQQTNYPKVYLTLKYKQGDLNKNGSLDAEDAAIMLKYISGSIQLDETQLEIADANSDGSKDMLDVISILNMAEIS